MKAIAATLFLTVVTATTAGANPPPWVIALSGDALPMTAGERRNLSSLFSSDALALDTIRRPLVQSRVDAKLRMAGAMWNALVPGNRAAFTLTQTSAETLRAVLAGRPQMAVVRGTVLEKLPSTPARSEIEYACRSRCAKRSPRGSRPPERVPATRIS